MATQHFDLMAIFSFCLEEHIRGSRVDLMYQKAQWGVGVKNFIAASILSCLIAGAICALTSPVNGAAGVAISVNRDAKGDRLPLLPAVQPSRRDSIKNEKPASKKSLVGCEPAFSAFAHPAHAQIFTHCAA
jgi:hypothetical protein